MTSPDDLDRPAPGDRSGLGRRGFLKGVAGAGLAIGAARGLTACGSDSSDAEGTTSMTPTSTAGSSKGPSLGPKSMVKATLGFIPLTDCAPLVIAKEKGFFEAHNIDATLENGKSWPAVRDKLLNGEYAAAHCLYSMPLSVATGVSKIEGSSDKPQSLRIAMMLSQNGQAITLASDLEDACYDDLDAAKAMFGSKKPKSLAMTFPGGTHDLWLRYWLKALGVEPGNGLEIKPVPPPEMFNNLNQENVRGYCVGEPWNARAVAKGKGFTAITSQAIWANHPEKALVTNAGYAEEHADALQGMMLAVLDAQRWLDDPANVAETAKIIGVPKYTNALPTEIQDRLAGHYDLGAGLEKKEFGDLRMRFFRDGAVPFPDPGYLKWAMAQYVRFGYLTELPDVALADDLILSDLYAEVAEAVGVTVPKPATSMEIALDGATFDPSDLEAEASRA
jgi:nitrate/nitrite transport system substrate-binding protein